MKFEELNAFAGSLKAQRRGNQVQPKAVREAAAEYVTAWPSDAPVPLFTEDELEWLKAASNI